MKAETMQRWVVAVGVLLVATLMTVGCDMAGAPLGQTVPQGSSRWSGPTGTATFSVAWPEDEQAGGVSARTIPAGTQTIAVEMYLDNHGVPGDRITDLPGMDSQGRVVITRGAGDTERALVNRVPATSIWSIAKAWSGPGGTGTQLASGQTRCVIHPEVSPGSDPTPVLISLGSVGGGGLIAFEKGPGGPSAPYGDIWTAFADGTDQQNRTDDGVTDHHPAWCPDGRQLVWERDGALWVMSWNGTDQRPLGIAGYQPSVSPDGTRVAFVRDVGGQRVFVASMCGSGEQELGPGQHPDWSPDGTRVAYDGVRVTNVNSGATDDPCSGNYPAWSPDGLRIACSSGGTVSVVDLASGNTTTIAGGTTGASAWSPDGNMIAYVDLASANVYVRPVAGGAAVPLTTMGGCDSPDWRCP